MSQDVLIQEASSLTPHFPVRCGGRSRCLHLSENVSLTVTASPGSEPAPHAVPLAPHPASAAAPRPGAVPSPFCRSPGPRPPPSRDPRGDPEAAHSRQFALSICSRSAPKTNGATSAPAATAPPHSFRHLRQAESARLGDNRADPVQRRAGRWWAAGEPFLGGKGRPP